MSACARPLSLEGFPTFVGHTSLYCCARNFDIVKLNFFTFLSWRIIMHILTAFSITFLTRLKNNGHPLLGLSSKVFTFDHLFTYILQTSLTVYQFLWLNGQKTVKTDAWALMPYSTNSVGLPDFHEVEDKIKESGKENESRKPTKWAGKIWREKIAYVNIWGKTSKIFLSLQILV